MEEEDTDQQESTTSCEQYSENVSLEIKGIPTAENETVNNIVTKIASLVGDPLRMHRKVVSSCDFRTDARENHCA